MLPCQILLPPIKTVGSTIRHRKPTMNTIFYLVHCVLFNDYTYPNPKPTAYSDAHTVRIVQCEENAHNIDVVGQSYR